MRYRDGQEAQVGDVVEFKYADRRRLAVLTAIYPGASSCNASAGRVLSGGGPPTGFVLISRPFDTVTVTLSRCELVRRFSVPSDLPAQ